MVRRLALPLVGLLLLGAGLVFAWWGFRALALEREHARVRARERAQARLDDAVVHVLGEAEVDFAAMVVRRGGASLPLTKLEAGVLALFVANPGRVLSRNRFLDEVWGYDRYPTTRTVDVHVARVREKIGDDGESPRFIHTVHGLGYRFDP